MRVATGTMIVDGAGVAMVPWIPAAPPDPQGGIRVSRSLNGGRTWLSPVTAVPDGVAPMFSAFQISADPTNPHAASIVFETQPVPEAQPWFTRTTDDGRTWQLPSPIGAPELDGAESVGLTTLPDGTLVDVAWEVPLDDARLLFGKVVLDPTSCTSVDPTPCVTRIHAFRSTDHGATWTDHEIVTLPDMNYMTDSVNEPPGPAVGPDGSVQVLVPVDHGRTRTWKIYRSIDGAHWSDTGATVPLGLTTYWGGTGPSWAIAPDGTLAVLHIEERDSAHPTQPCAASGSCSTNIVIQYSRDGDPWRRLQVAGPFDITKVGGWIGEYVDIRPLPDGIGVALSLGACEAGAPSDCRGAGSGPTDVYFAHVLV